MSSRTALQVILTVGLLGLSFSGHFVAALGLHGRFRLTRAEHSIEGAHS